MASPRSQATPGVSDETDHDGDVEEVAPGAPERPRLRKGTRRAMTHLLQTAGRLSAELDAICQRHGITRDQYEVLRILAGAGEEGLPRREISRRLVARAPDVTRLLDRLQGRELVARLRTSSDRRLSLSCITPPGRELLDRLRPEVDRAMQSFALPLPRKDLRRLARLLKPLTP